MVATTGAHERRIQGKFSFNQGACTEELQLPTCTKGKDRL